MLKQMLLPTFRSRYTTTYDRQTIPHHIMLILIKKRGEEDTAPESENESEYELPERIADILPGLGELLDGLMEVTERAFERVDTVMGITGIIPIGNTTTNIPEPIPLILPTSPENAPKMLALPKKMQAQMEQLMEDNYLETYSKTVGIDQKGDITLVEPQTVNNNAQMVFSELEITKDATSIGQLHSYLYPENMGNIRLSKSKSVAMIETGAALELLQNGEEQYMLLRTAQTPSKLDIPAFEKKYDARIKQLSLAANNELSEAIILQIANQEMAEELHLAYYEGKNGVLNKLYPSE